MERNPSHALANDYRMIQNLLRSLLLVVDTLALSGAFMLGYLLRQQFPLFSAPSDPPPFPVYGPLMIIHVTTMLMIFFFARLYHQPRAVSRIDTLYSVAASVSIGVVMTSGLTTIFLKGTGVGADYPRQMILYVWILSIFLVLLGRELHRQIVIRARVIGSARDRVLIVGKADSAKPIIQQIQYNPELGYLLVGVVNNQSSGHMEGIPILGKYEELPTIIDTYNISEVIIALPEAPHVDLMNLVALCQRGQVSIKIYPDLFAYMTGSMSVDELGGIPLLSVRDVALRGWKLSLKRALDIVGSLVGLILISPFMLLVSLLIKLESPGPVFFSQERAGLDGKPFPMLKFRSMRADAERLGSGWTVKNDPRITRIGKFLRRTNLDELPNFINVLFGQMSLVGPRPEQTAFVQKFRERIPRYMERHREKAGVTGWAQVNGLRGDTSIEERIKFDIWYVENWSLWLDIKIILRTFFQTVLGRSPNAY